MLTTTPRLSVAVVFALSLLVPQAASAGPLAPTKPSQVVTLRASGLTPCVFFPYAFMIDEVLTADGGVAPFAIPDGQVLVVTRLSWSASLGPPSQYTQAALTIEGGPAGSTLVVVDTAIADSWGVAGGSVEVPNVVVKQGVNLCLVSSFAGPNTNTSLVHGFFAKDK